MRRENLGLKSRSISPIRYHRITRTSENIPNGFTHRRTVLSGTRKTLQKSTTTFIHSTLKAKTGRRAFKIRETLAATLSSSYGIYNGFELCEARAAYPVGSEEYMDSEKYQYKLWDWDREGNIKEYISRINRIRRENPALQEMS